MSRDSSIKKFTMDLPNWSHWYMISIIMVSSTLSCLFIYCQNKLTHIIYYILYPEWDFDTITIGVLSLLVFIQIFSCVFAITVIGSNYILHRKKYVIAFFTMVVMAAMWIAVQLDPNRYLNNYDNFPRVIKSILVAFWDFNIFYWSAIFAGGWLGVYCGVKKLGARKN